MMRIERQALSSVDPEEATLCCLDGLPQLPKDQWDKDKIKAQGVLDKKPRQKTIATVIVGGHKISLQDGRRVSVIQRFNEGTGNFSFIPASSDRNITYQIPHQPLKAWGTYDDYLVEGPSLHTVLKRGSSVRSRS